MPYPTLPYYHHAGVIFIGGHNGCGDAHVGCRGVRTLDPSSPCVVPLDVHAYAQIIEF